MSSNTFFYIIGNYFVFIAKEIDLLNARHRRKFHLEDLGEDVNNFIRGK